MAVSPKSKGRMNDTSTPPLSAVDEIKRLDAVANTLFEVCVAVSVGAAAILLIVGSDIARISVFLAGATAAFVAISVVPDVVFAQRQPDLSEESLRRYVKKRQRTIQGGILFLLVGADPRQERGLAA